jgi:hypothetical protein
MGQPQHYSKKKIGLLDPYQGLASGGVHNGPHHLKHK